MAGIRGLGTVLHVFLLQCVKESTTLFFNKTSYVETKPLNTSAPFTLSFQTCAGGKILRQNGSNDDYFELSITPGTFTYSSGNYTPSTLILEWRIANVKSSVKVGQDLDRNLRFDVVFNPGSEMQNTTLTISVATFARSRAFGQMSVNVPKTVSNLLPRGNLVLGYGFIGCISFGRMFKVVDAVRNVSVSEICPLVENVVCQRSGRDCNTTTTRSSINMYDTTGYECICKPGYEGQFCDDEINECEISSVPCHFELCPNEHDLDYKCVCWDGYAGKQCSKNKKDCYSLGGGSRKCNHGQCRDEIGKFTCECDVGWINGNDWTFCNADIDECSLGYCQNNATCNNTQGSYACTCLAGYTGVNCSVDIDDCAGSPCLHEGICKDKVNAYECNCSPGYEGESCEIDIDWCAISTNNGSVPCCHGICIDGAVNYTCECFDGFSGQNCSIDEDECTSMPCENGATCVQRSNVTAVELYLGADHIFPRNLSDGYLCHCQPGFTGRNCEKRINELTDIFAFVSLDLAGEIVRRRSMIVC